MHKNDQNLKKFSSAVLIGTADTQFLLLILKNRFKFSIYESKIQKFFACGAKISHVHIFLPLLPKNIKRLHFSYLCPPPPKKIPGATPVCAPRNVTLAMGLAFWLIFHQSSFRTTARLFCAR